MGENDVGPKQTLHERQKGNWNWAFCPPNFHSSEKELVGVFSRRPSKKDGPHSLVAIVHICEIVGGELTLSHEGLALQYWSIEEMKSWHANHEDYARAAYKMWNSEQLIAAVSA